MIENFGRKHKSVINNLRTAFNFSIDPEQNRIEQAKFSAENIKGLLDRYRLDID